MRLWEFSALDSLFFREAKPFNLGEGGFLDSRFPPSAQTMAGAIRGLIGEALGVNWRDFHEGRQPEIEAVIGKSADDPGKLCFAGPYVMWRGERLFPVPLCLLHSADGGWIRLRPAGTELMTDLGCRRLPAPTKNCPGAKPLEGDWLDAKNFQKVLEGGVPESWILSTRVVQADRRTGIRRINQERRVEEGALYFTGHLRLGEDVSLGMAVEGADDIEPDRLVRLGGEGRLARVTVREVSFDRPSAAPASNRAAVVMISHGDFGGAYEPDWPDGVRCVSACIGRSIREGGWDYRKKRPKPLRALVPAGSVYFVEGDLEGLKKLTHLGERTEFGYGEFALGIWEEA